MRTITAIILGLAALVSLAMGTPPAPRNEPLDLVFEGRSRHALIRIPASYAGNPVPLMVSFHGRHGTGEDQRDLTHFNDVSDTYGFIVAYPDGVEQSWNALHGTGEAEALGVNDVGYTRALLNALREKYQIDPKRMYASGFSNGGFFTERIGCELSDQFAAIASVAGPMATALEPICAPGRPVPILYFHGTADRIVPYNGGETGGGGSGLSAPATAQKWAGINQCSTVTVESFRKGQVACRSYTSCAAPVQLCTVTNAGHTWPGGLQYASAWLVGTTNRDVDASEMIWQFVSVQTLP